MATNNVGSTQSRLTAMVTEADAVVLQAVEEAHGVGRPAEVTATYAEQEYDALATEQRESWCAEGEVAARKAAVQAAGQAPAAKAASLVLSEHAHEVVEARGQYQHAAQTLTPYVRRSTHDDVRYLAGWAVLGLGDTAGVLGAAIFLGEIPLVALGQALATGFAAVTAGLAGSEYQELRQARARQRPVEKLTEDERHYVHLFTEAGAARSTTRMVSWVAVTIMVLITVGIFALRAGTEGVLAGVAFGGLAAATALASFISSYVHADAAADLIAAYRQRYRRAERGHIRLARSPSLARHAQAAETAASIEREQEGRGEAAGQAVSALKYRMLRRNPQVVGHGESRSEIPSVGRRARVDGAS